MKILLRRHISALWQEKSAFRCSTYSKVRLRGETPISLARARICTVSLRTFMNNPGWLRQSRAPPLSAV